MSNRDTAMGSPNILEMCEATPQPSDQIIKILAQTSSAVASPSYVAAITQYLFKTNSDGESSSIWRTSAHSRIYNRRGPLASERSKYSLKGNSLSKPCPLRACLNSTSLKSIRFEWRFGIRIHLPIAK